VTAAGHVARDLLIVEADVVDLLREPRLKDANPFYSRMSPDEALNLFMADTGRAIILSCGKERPCLFLDADAKCSNLSHSAECVRGHAGG
jgi:hypothetical protein